MTQRVRDHMDTVFATLSPDLEIRRAIALLLEQHVTGAPVVDGEGRLLGLLSERECLRLLTSGHQNEPPKGAVRDFMTTKFTTISPEMNLSFVAGMFYNDASRRFLVVEGARLVGVLTRFDVLRAMRQAQGA